MNQHDSLQKITELVLTFRDQRDWRQFHSIRNLYIALTGEIGELGSLFQWVPDTDLDQWLLEGKNKERVSDELADVFAYLLLLAKTLDIDLGEALDAKVKKNGNKYPVDKSKGVSTKYSEL